MSAPRFLLSGSGHDPLVVVRSPFWNFNAIGLFDADEACVIDPGIYPEDIALLHAALRTHGRRGSPRRVTHVVVTHSHHDHIRGWNDFEGAQIVMPSVAAHKQAGARRRILAAKTAIDDHLGLAQPEFDYPTASLTFDERLRFRIGERDVELRFLPGHSNCTSVVWIPSLKTLCTADYLVVPGLPYCRWQARPFEEAVATMREWVLAEDIQRVVPAHNRILEGKQAILAALDREARYFADLRCLVQAARDEGLSPDPLARRVAEEIHALRDFDPGNQRRQDRDNARRVLAELNAG